MKLVIITGPEASNAFLEFATEHPTAVDPVDALQDGTVCQHVDKDGKIVGYSAYSLYVGFATLHFWSDEKVHPYDRHFIGDLHKVPELLGADRLMVLDPPKPVADVLRRMGWYDGGQICSVALPNHWTEYHGRHIQSHNVDLQASEGC